MIPLCAGFHSQEGLLFSSRRRHMRWNCDWSSDVCSSDLDPRVELFTCCCCLDFKGVVLVEAISDDDGFLMVDIGLDFLGKRGIFYFKIDELLGVNFPIKILLIVEVKS